MAPKLRRSGSSRQGWGAIGTPRPPLPPPDDQSVGQPPQEGQHGPDGQNGRETGIHRARCVALAVGRSMEKLTARRHLRVEAVPNLPPDCGRCIGIGHPLGDDSLEIQPLGSTEEVSPAPTHAKNGLEHGICSLDQLAQDSFRRESGQSRRSLPLRLAPPRMRSRKSCRPSGSSAITSPSRITSRSTPSSRTQ